jgi:hypothetical protein
MVRSEGILYALTPVNSATGNIAERATLGWSKGFSKSSSLYHQQLGIPLQLRDDGRHLFVKVGNRESKYAAVEARDENRNRPSDFKTGHSDLRKDLPRVIIPHPCLSICLCGPGEQRQMESSPIVAEVLRAADFLSAD